MRQNDDTHLPNSSCKPGQSRLSGHEITASFKTNFSFMKLHKKSSRGLVSKSPHGQSQSVHICYIVIQM
jgi:hypothetical protein